MDEAGAVGSSDIASLDVGGAARAGDEDGVARRGAGAFEEGRIILEMGDDARCVQDDNVVQRQEREEDRQGAERSG